MKITFAGLMIFLSTTIFAQRRPVDFNPIQKSKLLTILLNHAHSKIQEDPDWQIATDIFSARNPKMVKVKDVLDIQNPSKEKLFAYSKSNLVALYCYERDSSYDKAIHYSCELDVDLVISISDEMEPIGEIEKDVIWKFQFQFFPESLDLDSMIIKRSNIGLLSSPFAL
ncbi:MAG: hypothetical protein H6621_02745 [Halobacteriovoraceae bacterium]|nr:hypothetical protein [Halobacteriovoraceae bacterium]MCB9093962.1 hypothetical protein [Halobacteriovoraceae bacterium]